MKTLSRMRRLYQSMTATRFYITGLRMSRSPKGCQFDPLVRPPQASEMIQSSIFILCIVFPNVLCMTCERSESGPCAC